MERKHMTQFEKALTELIHEHRMEFVSDTPDYILAELLMECLVSWNTAHIKKEAWMKQGRPGSIKDPPVLNFETEKPIFKTTDKPSIPSTKIDPSSIKL